MLWKLSSHSLPECLLNLVTTVYRCVIGFHSLLDWHVCDSALTDRSALFCNNVFPHIITLLYVCWTGYSLHTQELRKLNVLYRDEKVIYRNGRSYKCIRRPGSYVGHDTVSKVIPTLTETWLSGWLYIQIVGNLVYFFKTCSLSFLHFLQAFQSGIPYLLGLEADLMFRFPYGSYDSFHIGM